MAETRNSNSNAPDVLAYNTSGLPLSMGVFFMTKDECLKRTRQLVEEKIGGEFTLKLDLWKDVKNSEYNVETKQNTVPYRASIQVWIPKQNSSIFAPRDNNGNIFFETTGVVDFAPEFKKFVNTYGELDDEGNAIGAVGKRSNKNYIVVMLELAKIFGLYADQDCSSYNQEFPQAKCNSDIDLGITAIYEGENPMTVLRGGPRDKRTRNITGFLIMKSWKNINNGINDVYRPSFKPRKRKNY